MCFINNKNQKVSKKVIVYNRCFVSHLNLVILYVKIVQNSGTFNNFYSKIVVFLISNFMLFLPKF